MTQQEIILREYKDLRIDYNNLVELIFELLARLGEAHRAPHIIMEHLMARTTTTTATNETAMADAVRDKNRTHTQAQAPPPAIQHPLRVRPGERPADGRRH